MIKLIATDIDGTLIEESTPKLYPEIEEEIIRLTNQGTIFACASGRQYASISRVFHNVADRIVAIAENGAHIRYKDQDISLTRMRSDYVTELVQQLRTYKDCEIVISTPDGSLMETQNEAFINLMKYGYHNTFRLVEDVLAEDAVILKVAVYHKDSIRRLGEDELIPAWKGRLKACMAGEEWVDFMDLSVDKGNAMLTVQKYFGVTRSETMAFGDNSNDIGLMEAAAESYAVENARPEVKKAAKYICPSWKEKGVWQIIRNVNSRIEEEDQTLYVSMLNGFKLTYKGEELELDKSSTSKPMQLLQMLLHAGSQGVAREVLQEVLYGGAKVADRTNNLKQTVFRLRKLVEDSVLPENSYISIRKSRYYWDEYIPLKVDTTEFMRLLELAEDEKETKQKLRYLMDACDRYSGEFLPRVEGDWAKEERSNYRNLYYEALRKVCSILKQESRYEEVLGLCRNAAALYPHEEWDLECLDCLIALERFQEAQEFYRETADYYAEEMHNNLSEALRERHALLSDRIRNNSGIIEEISQELRKSENQNGTYYCTYPNFEGICRQMARNQREDTEHATLLLCTMLDEKNGIPLTENKLNRLADKLFAAISSSLRKSDCFTRYSDNQFLILLVHCDEANSVYAQKRIAYYMEREYGVKSGIRYDAAALK